MVRVAGVVVGIAGMLLLAGCGGGGPDEAHLPLNPRYDKVLLVGWDAVQREHMLDMLAAGQLPHLQALSQEGSLIPTQVTQGFTDTRCGWAQILTGHRPAVTRVRNNTSVLPIPQGLTIYERAEKRYALHQRSIFTAHLAAKLRHLSGDTPEDPYYLTAAGVDYFRAGLHARENVLRETCGALDAHAEESFLIFCHFYEPDNAGHAHGENSPEYEQAIRQCDDALGQLRAHLAGLGLSARTALYVTTDHGFNEGDHLHYDAPDTFLAANVPLSASAGDRLDVGPTILQCLGLDPRSFRPATDGRPL